MTQWYPPSDNDTDVFGRGANDAKGSIACQVTAFLELREAGVLKEGDVCLMYDVGEEEYGDGMRTFVEALTWKPEFIMTGEPTESYQATGHKGSININVTSIGETAHSSVPVCNFRSIIPIDVCKIYGLCPNIKTAIRKECNIADHGLHRQTLGLGISISCRSISVKTPECIQTRTFC